MNKYLFLKKLYSIICILLLFFLFPSSSHAYVDPGTGSLLVQAIVAIIASVGAFWGSVKLKLFGKKKDKDKEKDKKEEE